MIEIRRAPAFGGMTGRTICSQISAMSIIRPVAGKTILRDYGEVRLPARIRVASFASHRRVFAG